MQRRYWVSFTWRDANPWILLFQEIGGKRMLLLDVVDVTVYRQLVGSLMYLVNTKPNIFYAVKQLSQVMVNPTKLFWKSGKHVLRYLRGTSEYGLWYRQI